MRNKLTRSLAVVLLAAVALTGVACENLFYKEVDRDSIGVRVRNIPFINKIETDPKMPGHHYYFPYLFTFYDLPRGNMKIEMKQEKYVLLNAKGTTGTLVKAQKTVSEENEEMLSEQQIQQRQELKKVKHQTNKHQNSYLIFHDRPTGEQSVRVKTSDGNDVWVDIIVTYQIIPNQAWKIVQNFQLFNGHPGANTAELEKVVESMVRGTIRSKLGELDTNKVLRAEDRKNKIEVGKDSAISKLNKSLAELGLTIVKLSSPSVTPHPAYEEVLNKKRIAEEEEEEYVSFQEKAKQERFTKVNQARGEADSMIAIANGNKEKVILKAKAVLEAKKLEAQAAKIHYDELAIGISAMTRELSGPGGDAQVGLAITEAIKGKKIIIVPSEGAFNMLDLNDLVQTYGTASILKNQKENQENLDTQH